MFRRLIALASTALITGALAGCGNTDSWVEAHAADGWPAQYGNAANSSYTDVAGAEALELEWSRSVKGDLGAAVALGLGTVSGGQRADPGRLLADGVGNRQQRAPALVHPAVAGRRVVEPVVGRLRQPLHRPARRDAVVPSDAVDPVAAAGHRNANHRKDSGAGPPSGGDPSGSGSAVRRPPRHRDRHSAGSGGGRQPDGFTARARRLPAGAAALPGRRRTRIRGQGGHGGGVGVAARRARVGARRAEIQPRPQPHAVGGLDQRRGQGGDDGQPGGVRGRFDDLRQRP